MLGYTEPALPRLRRSRLSQLARLVAVLWLCLATPSVLDIVVETASWLSGAECCADDCDESGEPCTQQCVHCVCGGHNAALPFSDRTRLEVAQVMSTADTRPPAGARSGHLEPPFRPPVG